jgi:hypothetical protein
MLFSAICCVLAAAVVLLDRHIRGRRFDAHELRIIRKIAERMRKEECHPFG